MKRSLWNSGLNPNLLDKALGSTCWTQANTKVQNYFIYVWSYYSLLLLSIQYNYINYIIIFLIKVLENFLIFKTILTSNPYSVSLYESSNYPMITLQQTHSNLAKLGSVMGKS